MVLFGPPCRCQDFLTTLGHSVVSERRAYHAAVPVQWTVHSVGPYTLYFIVFLCDRVLYSVPTWIPQVYYFTECIEKRETSHRRVTERSASSNAADRTFQESLMLVTKDQYQACRQTFRPGCNNFEVRLIGFITSAKEVMFLPDFVCLSVYVSAR